MNIIFMTIGGIFVFPITYVLFACVFYRIGQDDRYKNRPILGKLYNLPAIVLGTVGYFVGWITGLALNLDPFYSKVEEVRMYASFFIIPISTVFFYLLGFWLFKRYKKKKDKF